MNIKTLMLALLLTLGAFTGINYFFGVDNVAQVRHEVSEESLVEKCFIAADGIAALYIIEYSPEEEAFLVYGIIFSQPPIEFMNLIPRDVILEDIADGALVEMACPE